MRTPYQNGMFLLLCHGSFVFAAPTHIVFRFVFVPSLQVSLIALVLFAVCCLFLFMCFIGSGFLIYVSYGSRFYPYFVLMIVYFCLCLVVCTYLFFVASFLWHLPSGTLQVGPLCRETKGVSLPLFAFEPFGAGESELSLKLTATCCNLQSFTTW